VAFACLDLTNHAACTRSHASATYRCDDDIGVVEGYASNGIVASDSQHVSLRDLRIHGLDTGIHAGRIDDWILDRVEIRGNLSAGWNDDIEDDDHNTGPVTMRNGSISWSGCIEPYPDASAISLS
jgi:hypothetical protein